ncbi:MAG: serine/threonine protein kinase [Gemmatimonadaceae bacterium]|nr:serine/threonine protein kinase [Gemmatimonadaceae bacterium]
MTSESLPSGLSGRYELQRELGAGGMATVYLARDVRHNRQVALKVLHPELSAVIGPERFLKEIELTANLQHPHILPLFDSGEANGQLFYVMPFVEGETLRARLTREQQLPIPDVIGLAREVAGALQYAHERGVIHRDIKPENILLQGGHALVADFGIALAVQQAGGQRMTQTGLSLGTPQYMAPEQAMGERAVDARADVYALGAVTYEMLTGEPPFSGPSSQAIVARVLTVPPAPPAPPAQTRSTVPAHVEAAVLAALQKLPADRPATAQKFADALTGGLALAPPSPPVASTIKTNPVRRGVPAWLFIAACALCIVMGWLAWRSREDQTTSVPATRFTLALPDSIVLAPLNTQVGVAMSPDGREFLFPALGPNGLSLYRRRLDSLRLQQLPATVGTGNPMYSPDGNWLTLEDEENRLVRVPVAGGTPQIVDNLGYRSSWGEHDRLLFLREGRLYLQDGFSTAPRLLATPKNGEFFAFPFVLPGADEALVNIIAPGVVNPDEFRIAKVSLKTGAVSLLNARGAQPRFVPPNFLLTSWQDQSLRVAEFSPAATAEVGSPTVALENVLVRTGGGALYGVSRNGVLAYVTTGGTPNPVLISHGQTRVIRVDRSLGVLVGGARFSPDGSQFTLATDLGGNVGSILIGSSATGDVQPLVRSPGFTSGSFPVWRADGRAIIWAARNSLTEGGGVILQKAVDGTGLVDTLYRLPKGEGLYGLESCGARDCLLLQVRSPSGDVEIRELTLTPSVNARRLLTLRSFGVLRVSPDGRWLATTEIERGAASLFIFDLAHPERRVLVVGASVSQMAWLPDSATSVYRYGNDLLTATLQVSDRVTIARRDTLGVGKWASISPGALANVGSTLATIDAKTGTLLGSVSPAGSSIAVVVVTDFLDELRRRLALTKGQ